MGGKIFGILFLILAAGVVLYLSSSGVFTKLAETIKPPAGSTSTQPLPSPSGSGNGVSSPTWTPWTPPPSVSGPAPGANSGGSTINPSEIPQGFTVSQLSPYFHKVRIGGVSPGSLDYMSQITLTAYISDASVIDATGWRFQSNRGGIAIPQAIAVYDPTGLTAPSDMYLRTGEVVYFYSTVSPLGQNIKPNKCIGYLANHLDFNPPFYASCPSRDLNAITTFTGKCQDYIRSLGSCSEAADNPPVPQSDYACRDYLKRINYRGCFEDHRGDQDFLSREWRVWTGSKFLDFSHDRVLLLDNQGLVVDMYTY